MSLGHLVAVLLALGFFEACDLTLVVDGARVRASHHDRDELRCRYAGRAWDARRSSCS